MPLSKEAMDCTVDATWFNGWHYRGVCREALGEMRESFMKAFPDGQADMRSVERWLVGESNRTFLLYNLFFGTSGVHHELFDIVENAVRDALVSVAESNDDV